MQEVDNFINEIQALDAGKVEDKGDGGEMDDNTKQTVNNVDDQDDTEIDILDLCLVFPTDTNRRKQCFTLTHLRAQGDSLKGACAAKCSKFDFEKFENSIIPLKGACAPMRGNRVWYFESP